MDDLYMNDGSYYQPEEPAMQILERQEERSKATAAVPLLKDLVKRFDERIAFYDSVESIDVTMLADEKRFMRQWEANKLTKDNLILERDYLRDLLDRYAK